MLTVNKRLQTKKQQKQPQKRMERKIRLTKVHECARWKSPVAGNAGKKKKRKSSLSSSKADFQNEQSIDKIAF